MHFYIQGRVDNIGEVETVGDKGFQKREVQVTHPGRFDQYYTLECIYDAISENLEVGGVYTFKVELRGRKWEKDGLERRFMSLSCSEVVNLEEPAAMSTGSPF
jgi:hypothetical protein